MSFKEANKLRKEEKLDEALLMVNQDLEDDPENIWNKRAASWVYYEYLKKYSEPDSFDAFKENLIKLKDLQLPEDEKMVFDNSAWQIGSMVFGLQKQENVDYGKINELLDIIKGFHFNKPSEEYSFIYKAFHKGYRNWSSYIHFADWWEFENFTNKDYSKDEFKGKKIMSLVEQAYIAYSKKLLEGKPIDSFGQQVEIDKEKIQSFLPKLDVIIEKYPNYQYPPYFKAKLLLELGEGQDSLSSFLPFALKKRNEFWVWDVMADIFSHDVEMQFACFCKALSLKTQEDFLIKLRLKFASLLIEREMYSEAKFEINKVKKIKENHGWNLSNQIKRWINQEWYLSSEPTSNNQKLYQKHIDKAEEVLYKDIPEEVIAVEFVNANKNMLNFIKNKKRYGFFKYPKKLNHPQVGDVLKVRFNGGSDNGFFRALTVKEDDSKTNIEALKTFEGEFKKITNMDFGFIDDIYVNKKIIQKYNLKDSQILKGRAIMSYNKKKEEWGWKAFEIFSV